MSPHCLNKNATFESGRLYFRGITAGDTHNLVRWRSREDVYIHTPNPRPITHAEHTAWFARYMANKSSYRAIITEKNTGKDIGMVGGECEGEAFVISYYIGEPEHRGMGFAGEAIKALIEFIQPTAATIHAHVQHGNAASISCLTRIGFVRIVSTEKSAVYKYVSA